MSMVRLVLEKIVKNKAFPCFLDCLAAGHLFNQQHQLGEKLHPCRICSLVYKIQSAKLLAYQFSINFIFACSIYFSFNCISSIRRRLLTAKLLHFYIKLEILPRYI